MMESGPGYDLAVPAPQRIPSTLARRLGGAALALASAAPLAVAAALTPASDGHGTHTQIGLPACGWVVAFDRPCPTCGMTTAFTHAADGELLSSAATQPFGALLAISAAACVWAGLHVALTGCRLGGLATSLLAARSLWILGALAAAAWIYKVIVW